MMLDNKVEAMEAGEMDGYSHRHSHQHSLMTTLTI